MAWTPEHDTRLRELHARELSVRAIADELDVSKSLVSRKAQDLGLAFDRSRTAAATQAVAADNKARRALLAARFLDEAQAALDRITQPYVMTLGSKDGPMSITLDEPDAGAHRNFITAAAVAADKHIALEKVDADGVGEVAKSMLEKLLELVPDGPAPVDTEAPPE